MKMTIGRKLSAGFAFLLAMFIAVGLVVYILNSRVIKDAIEVSQDDVPSVILSFSLLDKLEDMDVNVLKYMTGQAEERANFNANRQAFLTFFDELTQIENQLKQAQVIEKINDLFSNYTNTANQEIFSQYNPKVEEWAKKQADLAVHQHGAALKKSLTEIIQAALKEERLTTVSNETADNTQPVILLYLALLDKVGELENQLTEYVAGKAVEKESFAANATEFENFFNKIKALKHNSEMTPLNDMFSAYTKFKKAADAIFLKYHPETKKEALATLYQLEQQELGQLELILDQMAAAKKQNVMTATSDIIYIIKEMTYTTMAVIVIAILAGLGVSIFLARSITKPLALIVQGSNLLVAGDMALSEINRTQIDNITQRQDEMGDIGRAFDAQASYFKTVIEDIVQVSMELAAGHLGVTPKADYRGDFVQIKTALETTLSNQRQVIEDMVRVSQGLADGHLDVMPQAEYQGDFAQIKQAMETALPALQQVIEDIVRVSQNLAAGHLSVMPQGEYQGDIAQIKQALEQALPHQQQVIEDIMQVSQGLAEGNLHIAPKTEYRGDFVQIKNALEDALSALRQVIDDIVHVSQGLAEGNLNVIPQAEYQGDFIQIKKALETAALKLADATAKNAQQDWLKTGQTQLNDQVRGDQNITTQAKKIISFLSTYAEAQIGLFYLLEELEPEQRHESVQKAVFNAAMPVAKKPYLKLIASYAYTKTDHRPDQFLLGEGLIGQVALEQKTLSIIQTAEECTHIIRSGLTNALPRYVIIIPFLYENVVKGVIELGSSKPLEDIQREFLEQAIPNIGIAVNTAESRTKMQQLLQQTQAQAEELQNQQEELQQTNEELQSQSEELRTQQEELQSVNEELQHQRKELQHKQEVLQQQNEELQSQSEELQTQQEELTQTNEALQERTNELERQQADIQQKNTALEITQAEMEKIQVEMEKNQAALVIKAHELELASQYKSEFLANMSHELRTPLNSLLILAQLLGDNKKGNLSDKQVEYARTIHSAGTDLLKLINEILDLSKVEAGKMEVQAENLSLTELVETIEQKFRPVAVDKGLAFQITVAQEAPPQLQTDAQRLKQILNNLLSNAFKFTEQGEVRLKIDKPTNGQNPQPVIAFCVTDTGIGIPKNKQELIFEAFQQVDGTTSRRFGGTGLGLSISRQLAQLLGGELQLHSEEGHGTTFTLYLPEIHQTEEVSKPPKLKLWTPTSQESSDEDEKNAVSINHETIADDRDNLKPEDKSLLIIEDDRKFSSLMIEFAREKGFKCIIAEDGATGLRLAEEYRPYAIMLDVGLPQLDGWAVMDRLKDNPDIRHIPVHFISAAEQSKNAKKMGAIGYLLKPVSLEELGEAFDSIEQFLAKTVKNLLVVADNEPHQQKILELLESKDIQTTVAVTIAEALQQIKEALFDCIILDMDIEQRTGIKLLEQMRQGEGFCQIPVIVYTERDLTSAEETLLLQCADYLTVKTASSPERLLDEATLFLHQIEAHLPAAQQQMLRMVHDKEAILTGKKVLIVDDDIRNTFALTTFLEDKNLEVIVGNNGKEALTLLEKHPDIAIILMDIMMPEMDGYEAMREIRSQRPFRKLPIIALTAKAMKGDKSKCIEAGANDYLSKPVDTDKLISLMRVWLYR